MPVNTNHYSIEILKEDDAIKETISLRKWIENAELGTTDIQIRRKELMPDDAGGMLIPGLDINLQESLIKPFSKTIASWLSKPKNNKEFRLKIKRPDGVELEVEVKNEQVNVEDLMDTLMNFFENKTVHGKEDPKDEDKMKHNIKYLVSRGELQQALEMLETFVLSYMPSKHDDFILLLSRYSQIRDGIIRGYMNREEQNVSIQSLNHAILAYLNIQPIT